MTQTHPLTPPEELLEHWDIVSKLGNSRNALTLAARWGADQELEAVEKEIIAQAWFANSANSEHFRAQLRAARRPKPPSVKEQALEALETLNQAWTMPKELEAVITIRRALEALPND
jgi:hypothetical protein